MVVLTLVFYLFLLYDSGASAWTADTLPNPVTEAAKCGNAGSGFVCNPDSVLTGDQGEHS